jgi:hypothetical protein
MPKRRRRTALKSASRLPSVRRTGQIGSEYVFNASMEAMQQGFQQPFLFGFAIQAKAREMLDKLKIPTTYVAVTPDVVMSDLLKTSRSSEILPDVTLDPAGHKPDGTPLHQVEVTGQVVATNPARAVRGPKHVVKTGRKTTVLTGVMRADVPNPTLGK